MIAIAQKKGPAEAATSSPSHGSPQALVERSDMNTDTHTTDHRAAPDATRNVVIIPAQFVSPCDLLDGGLDQLLTIHTALNPDNRTTLDNEVLFSIWAALRHAMNDLNHLRDYLNDVVQ